jgi:YcxB-like protein
MEESISLHYFLVEDDFLDAVRVHRRLSRMIRFANNGYFGLLVLVSLLIPIIATNGDPVEKKVESLVMLTPALAFGWTILAAGSQIWKFKVRKQFRSLHEGERTIAWEVDDDVLTCRSSLSESCFRWELLKKLVEAPRGFLLYVGEERYLFLPARAFGSPEAIRQFANLARAKVANYVALGECQYVSKPEPIVTDEF